MKRYIIILALLFGGITLRAEKLQDDAFARGNEYYNDNQYDSALIVYNRIIDEGYISVPLFYNIGNSYFKLRNVPMAIYYYEKALKLDPKNEDVKNNLEIANALITDKIEPLPEFFLKKLWRNIGNIMTANGWATVSIIIFAILLISIFLYLNARSKAMRKSMFFTGLLAILLCVVSVIFAAQKSNYLKTQNEAIVIKPTITVKSSPSASGVDLFVLHEGAKVEIKENESGWNKIRIADGSIGWMPEEAIIRY